jgi:hypothetical protein
MIHELNMSKEQWCSGQGNMKVLSEKPVPALEETQGVNNKNFTTINQLHGEKFDSRIQTIYLGKILSSCDMNYGGNGLSRHTVPFSSQALHYFYLPPTLGCTTYPPPH